jgi:phage-related protein
VARTVVCFYRMDDESVPMLDWLTALPKKAQQRCRVRIERLRELGHELRRPEADYLRDGIYELRAGFQGTHYRMLYFFHGKAAVVLSHGLIKERAVPPLEIERAVRRKLKVLGDPTHHIYEDS